ncbi:MAG: VWA-like domain-containing protein [Flavimaricola sp.]|nr:VWA-like domain-containing protein [Flavimaricola sp.]
MTEVIRHSQRAGPALRALAEADPALAALSLWCDHRDGEDTRTGGGTITYGPDFEALPLHEQIGLAAHHILHVALRHPQRLSDLQTRLGPGFEANLYNLAADALVNEALQLADHALPRPAVLLTDLLSEGLGIKMTSEAALAEWDVDRLYHALATRSSGVGGPIGKAWTYARTRSFDPDLDPSPGGSDTEGEVEQAARWRQHLTRALDAGRQAGRGIGRIGHRIADIPEPRTPWELILRRLLTQAVMVRAQPSARRPSRRWIAGAAQAVLDDGPTPGFEPGLRPLSEVPRIALAIDASGSIDDARFDLFWGEVAGIARRLRAEIHLMVFDDDIRHRARVDPTQSVLSVPELPRGGGTAFVPVIREAQRLKASAVVVLTDLEGDPGPPPRGLSVIWALPEPAKTAPPFGRVVDLSS